MERKKDREREKESREVESFERALTRRDGTSRWVVDSPFLLSSNPGPGPRPRTRFPSALRPSSSLPFTFSYTTRLCVLSFSLSLSLFLLLLPLLPRFLRLRLLRHPVFVSSFFVGARGCFFFYSVPARQ